jgi:epoxide hydrolase
LRRRASSTPIFRKDEQTSTTISPFRIEIPQARARRPGGPAGRTRWSASPERAGWEYSVPLGYFQELVEYWRTTYDWRAAEAELNSCPQFTTEIDEANVHLIHSCSAEPGALPLILTHGWPGSVLEFLDIISPLTDPVAHSGTAIDTFTS